MLFHRSRNSPISSNKSRQTKHNVIVFPPQHSPIIITSSTSPERYSGHPNSMEPKKYLTHVNALRGFAILLVFLYHLQEQWCPQGFLGVDAFFVISGYFLIPALLNNRYRGGCFSLLDYYNGKIVRILPPLVVMTLVALLAAIPLMIDSDLLMAASSARTVITGRSNIYLGLAATDYFAPSVKENIFLHTWYIAALIQVLIAAPLLCRPLSRLRTAWQYLILALIAIASLLIYLQHWLPREWQETIPSLIRDGGRLGSVYYMTAGRLWEIIAGAFIVLLPSSPKKGLRTLLLSLGLLLLIIRYGEDTHLTSLFENKAIMWLGTVSFSLYLIHWPTMALARYALMHDFTLLDCIWVTLLSLLLTWALYKGVEKRHPHLLLIALLWALTMALAITIQRTDGLKNYVHIEINTMREYTSTDYKDWEFAPKCNWVGPYPKELNPIKGHYGDSVLNPNSPDFGQPPVLQIGDKTKQPNFILLGDSYANAIFPGFDIIGKQEGWSGLYLNLYATPFWGRLNQENSGSESQFTRPKAENLIEWLKANPHLHHIIIHQRWHKRFLPAETWSGEPIPPEQVEETGRAALMAFCNQVKSIGKSVIFVMPTPESAVPSYAKIIPLVKRHQLWYHANIAPNLPNVRSTQADYDLLNTHIRNIMIRLEKEGYCNLIDPVPYMIKNGIFDPIEGDNLIVYDHGHMTIYGATQLISQLRHQINIILTLGEVSQK